MSAVILQDEIIHYEVLGRGRPLIFLHGWVGSWRYWIPAMQAASVSFRTYALDLWGFGDTAKNPDYYTLEHQFKLVDAFLNEMGIGRVALIGHGLGAVISLLYAYRYAQVVDRIMVIGLPNGTHDLNPRLFNSSPVELADWLLDRTPDGEAARMEAPKADPDAVRHSLNSLQAIDLYQLMMKIHTACLMVYGQNDPAIVVNSEALPVDYPEHIHQILFEQSGHFPMLDEPSKFNRLVADFLALNSGSSPRQLQLKEEWKRRVR